MAKKGSNPPENPASDAQAKIAEQLFRESTPIRQQLNQEALQFLQGDRDVTATPGFANLKGTIESQFGRARDATIANTPTGGGLTSALQNLEGQRAGSLVQGVAGLSEAEIGRAFTLGTGLTSTAVSGLGQAGFTQGQAISAQAQANAGKATGTGSALGQIASAVIGK